MQVLLFWRRHPESDRGIADLQSAALPLGYGAVVGANLMLSRSRKRKRSVYSIAPPLQNETAVLGFILSLRGDCF